MADSDLPHAALNAQIDETYIYDSLQSAFGAPHRNLHMNQLNSVGAEAPEQSYQLKPDTGPRAGLGSAGMLLNDQAPVRKRSRKANTRPNASTTQRRSKTRRSAKAGTLLGHPGSPTVRASGLNALLLSRRLSVSSQGHRMVFYPPARTDRRSID